MSSSALEHDFKFVNDLLSKRVYLSIKEPYIMVTLKKYEELLTNAAYNHVENQVEKHEAVTFFDIDEPNQTCKSKFKTTSYVTGIDCCECPFWLRFKLPCYHIFGVRKLFEKPLFDSALCKERWTKQYNLQNKNPFLVDQNNSVDCKLDMDTAGTISFKNTSIKTKKNLTVPEKRKIVNPIVKEIAEIVRNKKFFMNS